MMHAFICECSRRRCRERIYMEPARWDTLARRGMVLSQECARRDHRVVLERFPGGVVLQAQNAGKVLLASPAMGLL